MFYTEMVRFRIGYLRMRRIYVFVCVCVMDYRGEYILKNLALSIMTLTNSWIFSTFLKASLTVITICALKLNGSTLLNSKGQHNVPLKHWFSLSNEGNLVISIDILFKKKYRMKQLTEMRRINTNIVELRVVWKRRRRMIFV